MSQGTSRPAGRLFMTRRVALAAATLLATTAFTWSTQAQEAKTIAVSFPNSSKIGAVIMSGINNGANMGDDTLYSGTVAAASEGYLFGIPAIAFSLAEKGWAHIDSAARAARLVVERHLAQPLAAPVLLNVNIPSRRFEDMHGFAVTRLGKRHPSQPVVRTTTPYGDTVYWIGPVGMAADAAPGTDFHAVEQGTVSVTPLRLDLTQHSQLDEIRTWAEPLCANA